jgi:hypothetical protein
VAVAVPVVAAVDAGVGTGAISRQREWHACVHGPQLGGQPLGPVPLQDAAGRILANDLADGQEVEIVSWRPRAREGVAYQIRRLTDGTEWWIGAIYLRRRRHTDASTPTV